MIPYSVIPHSVIPHSVIPKFRDCITVLAVLFLFTFQLHAQLSFGYRTEFRNFEISELAIFPKDTITKADTVKEKLHSPKKAALMSAIVPGLGQIYNKKYWKLAIIYPAMGGIAYGFGFNHKNYKVYRDALRIRYDGDSTTIDQFSLYSDDRVVTMKNYYQRYRDLCVIGFAAVYLLQVIDAAVDAHLYYFDVGPDLSLRWSPKVEMDPWGGTMGLGLTFTSK